MDSRAILAGLAGFLLSCCVLSGLGSFATALLIRLSSDGAINATQLLIVLVLSGIAALAIGGASAWFVSRRRAARA